MGRLILLFLVLLVIFGFIATICHFEVVKAEELIEPFEHYHQTDSGFCTFCDLAHDIYTLEKRIEELEKEDANKYCNELINYHHSGCTH